MMPAIAHHQMHMTKWIRLFGCWTSLRSFSSAGRTQSQFPPVLCDVRGGASSTRGSTKSRSHKKDDAYQRLARAVLPYLQQDDDSGQLPDIDKVISAFHSISAVQQTFKGMDGMAHEAYQRTHDDSEIDLAVSGRAQRSVLRAGAVADGLFACELCEIAEMPNELLQDDMRQLVLNETIVLANTDLTILVFYEPNYNLGAGKEHGGILPSPSKTAADGRLIVVLVDGARTNLASILKILSNPPKHVRLKHGLEAASVQPDLYQAAGSTLEVLEPLLRTHNASAVHFVGRSLAGGVASLSAAILEGQLPMPKVNSKENVRSKKSKKKRKSDTASDDKNLPSNATVPLEGLCEGRVSAVTLGAPPCISPNVPADCITSILFGDDIVCRCSSDSYDRFLDRTRRALNRGGLARSMSWMTDTLSLAASNLKSHAHGSEGEEARLSVAGRAFLIRPRRLGDSCSIHEVGNALKGGREALRSAVLWQLNDVLISKSLWKHHALEAHIQGLDKVHLRGLEE